MGKKFIMFFLTAVLAAVLSGCTKTSEKGSMANTDTELQNGEKVINGTETPLESGDVELVVWGAEEDEALLNRIFESFQEEYKGQANFHITFAPQSESNCKDYLMADLEAGADVFAFADDQLNIINQT